MKPKQCPDKRCRSTRIMRHGPDSNLATAITEAWGSSVSVAIDQCRECFAIWEPWPDDDPGPERRDMVECEPCPNCAYRAGSRESKDPEEWARLRAIALNAGPKTWFCCHRGIPIKVDEGAIRFDFEAAEVDPLQQSCIGFMRIVWMNNGAPSSDDEAEPFGAAQVAHQAIANVGTTLTGDPKLFYSQRLDPRKRS